MVIYVYDNDNILHTNTSKQGKKYATAIIRLGKYNWMLKNRRGSKGSQVAPQGEVKNHRALMLLIDLLADNNIMDEATEAKLRLLRD